MSDMQPWAFERLKRIRGHEAHTRKGWSTKKNGLLYMGACASGIRVSCRWVKPSALKPALSEPLLLSICSEGRGPPQDRGEKLILQKQKENSRTDSALLRNCFCCPSDSQKCSAADCSCSVPTQRHHSQDGTRHRGPARRRACNRQTDAKETEETHKPAQTGDLMSSPLQMSVWIPHG